MLNQGKTLLYVFGIFFVFIICSIGFAQSDKKSESVLSSSQYIEILKEIRQLDTKMAERIGEQNTKTAEKLGELNSELREYIDTKISGVNDNLDEVKKDVAFMKGMFTTIQGITTIFGGPILVGIIIVMAAHYIQNRKNKAEVDTESKVRAKTEVDAESEVGKDIETGLITDISPETVLRDKNIKNKVI